ncbi:glycosyl transferase group 1 [Thalassoporum mexicanum PCC 7367]|uniref:glycosyltransferase family 4 protein n=1 Tax=Thalassoporum mexicanum TaxID=3457544 RepID=UPI00029FF156|nr:glycosyltransferase family 4 protein [Pseudanabaena sp. PCC 7367]AFY68808.1 glycosyl transferase group 1 [Pseudanabaena sp. PCC 7367]
MRVLHLATHEGSGAGRAAGRIHLGLRREKFDSHMLVAQKSSELPTVVKLDRYRTFFKKVQARLFGRELSKRLGQNTTFSINATASLLRSPIDQIAPDLINLHWVGWEYFKIEDLAKLQKPLVWTLQDMWPFTGGCHYSQGCDRYLQSCGNCPQLKANQENDLSRWVWQRKARSWQDLDLTIVTPSTWMADCARASSLFKQLRIETIPFGLDTQIYRPIDPQLARQKLALPTNKKLVLFGALSATQDHRKGFHLLIPALTKLAQSEWGDRIELVVFGASRPDEPIDLGFPTHYLGQLNTDAALTEAYSAADVMIVPSVEEAFGQTASEALACGTPVIAFRGTGVQDIVDHQQTGYLVKPYEVEDLAAGIAWVLDADPELTAKLRYQSRLKAETEFSLSVQAQRYLKIYAELANADRQERLPQAIPVLTKEFS